MTAVEFSPQERARLDAMEAAEPAPESWRGLRLSPDGTLVAICRGENVWHVSNGGHYRDKHVADWTPLAVIKGDPS